MTLDDNDLDDDDDDDDDEHTGEYADVTGTGLEATSINGGGESEGNSAGNSSEVDSLEGADDAEVEQRVLTTLKWQEIGRDAQLKDIDLERWKTIGKAHTTEGTDEYGE